MTIAVLVLTDGRDDYLRRTIDAAREQFAGPITEWWMHDDTGDVGHRTALTAEYPEFHHIAHGGRRGFGGAIQHSWGTLAAQSQARWVLHLEGDFVVTRPVDLAAITDTLSVRPQLVQMALRRQAWSADEVAAGGVVELDPDAYEEVSASGGRRWLEHRKYFTTNPSVYRRSLCSWGWPEGPESEGHFGIGLFRHGSPESAAVRCGLWGARDSGVWAEHIGVERVGNNY